MDKIKTALKTQKFQTIKAEDLRKTPSSVKIVESERSVNIDEPKSSVLLKISSLSQDSVKPTAKARFRAVKDKIVNKNKRQARTTIVAPKEADNQKKNLAYYDKEIYQALKKRKDAQVTFKERDATPKVLTESDLVDIEENIMESDRKKRSNSLWDKLFEKSWKPRVPTFTQLSDPNILFDVADLDEITAKPCFVNELFEPFVKNEPLNDEEREDITKEKLVEKEKSKENLKTEKEKVKIEKPKKIAKVYLKESETFDLCEISSLIVQKGTEEGNAMEKFNANYAFITSGAGRRRTSEAEIQTEYCPLKTRSINTEIVKKVDQESFATNYGIYDAFQEIEQKSKTLKVDDDEDRNIEVLNYTGESENSLDLLGMNENFLVASMIVERALSENVFRSQQMRKFNVPSPNSLDVNSKILYRMETLWSYKSIETMGKDVVDMSWCPSNGDLLAVAYGTYNYRKAENRISGAVLVWSGKNPVNPERRYCYRIPVSAVEFSQQIPQYLAVAFYDGSIEVIDITPAIGKTVIARSERKSSPVFDPIWSIQWIQVKNEDLILTASQDGRVMKFKMGSGPDLVGFPQVYLERVEGTVEALSIEHKKTLIEGNHHPQAWCLKSSPVSPDVYFVGTDEGCVHICSTNFPHQHFGVLQLHNGGISSIEFSPFSPKIFLTAGSDWTVRIWIEGILEPILELSDGFGAVHNAYWSPTNPTIIATCTREAVRVWDLLRKNPKPAIVKNFGKELTVFKFSPCGRSFVVGDCDGNTRVVAFEDFPFPPHYQFDQLKKLLDSLLRERPELRQQVKDLGFLGYESGKKFGKI